MWLKLPLDYHRYYLFCFLVLLSCSAFLYCKWQKLGVEAWEWGCSLICRALCDHFVSLVANMWFNQISSNCFQFVVSNYRVLPIFWFITPLVVRKIVHIIQYRSKTRGSYWYWIFSCHFIYQHKMWFCSRLFILLSFGKVGACFSLKCVLNRGVQLANWATCAHAQSSSTGMPAVHWVQWVCSAGLRSL